MRSILLGKGTSLLDYAIFRNKPVQGWIEDVYDRDTWRWFEGQMGDQEILDLLSVPVELISTATGA